MSQKDSLLGNHDFDRHNDGVEMSDDPFMKAAPTSKGKFKIYYETLFWTIWGLLSLWTVVDRFTSNLLPMGLAFKPLSESLTANNVEVAGTVMFFDGFGRATGRLFINSFNALFYTQCKTTENFLMEHHPSWLQMGDIRTVHNKTHYIMGVFFMGIPMILHVSFALLPLLQGLPVVVGSVRPPTRVTPFVYNNNGIAHVFLSDDDTFRMVLVYVLFGVLFPFSMSNVGRRKWFAPTQWLHLFCAALFTIDQIRRSPHSQVFSVPVIAFWILDRVFGLVYYRTGQASVIHKELLDSDYMVVFLYVPKQKRQRAVGSTYYIAFTGLEGQFEIAHPYIAFQNHSGDPLLAEWRNRDASSTTHKFYVERSAGERKAFNRRASLRLDEQERQEQLAKMDHLVESGGIASETDDVVFFSNWNTAIVIQIHEWNRGTASFSRRLADKPLASRIRFWGPYLSEYGDLTPDGRLNPPLVLVGTGSGCGPIIDFYLHFTTNNEELINPVTVYYSTNSVGLFQFVTDLLCAKSISNFSVNAHLTQAEDYDANFEEESNAQKRDSHSSARDMKLGRLSFMDVLAEAPKSSYVFFCGAAGLGWKVEIACATYGLKYHPGHRFSSEGRISCTRVGKTKFACACTKFPLCCCY